MLRTPGVPDTISSFALLAFLATTVDKSLAESVVRACASFLRNALARAIVAAERVGNVPVFDSLRLLPLGQVAGMHGLVATCPPSLRPVLRATWDAMRESGCLTSPWDQETHPLFAVLHLHLFILARPALSRQTTLSLATASANHIRAVRARLLQWCAAGVDHYVLHEYASVHDTAAPAPAVRSCGHGTRKYTLATVETMWDVQEQARTAGVSAEQVARVRQGDAHLGCSEGTTLSWPSKLNSLYQMRR